MSPAYLFIDGSIIVVYFVGILWLGLYMGRREDSLHDFALGGRRMPWWAVMASIIAAETSAATFLGVPGEGYKARSIIYAQLVIGIIIGRVLVAVVFLKPYYRYKVYTVYDYLSVRFGEKSKNYASALFLVMRTLASGSRVFVPSLIMVLAWNLLTKGTRIEFTTRNASLAPYIAAIAILTIITCLYTAAGGIKAVIWTDLIQATLMFGSALVAIATILYHIGGDSMNLMKGLRALGESVPEMKRLEGYFMFGWEPDRAAEWMRTRGITAMTAWEYARLIIASPYTLVSAFITTTIGNVGAFGTDQDMVQRLLTAETYKKSRRSMIMSSFMDIPIASAFAFIGVLLIVYFEQNPAFLPTTANGKPDTDNVFASYILNVMPVGIRGLVLAGVFATAMGSLSAALNALATSATNDWYIPYFARDASERRHVLAARFFTALFTVLMILIAVGSTYVKIKNPDFRIIPFVIGIAGLFLGPMLGMFLLGMFTKRRGSDFGNMIAVTIGLAAMPFISGQHIDFTNMVMQAVGSPTRYQLPSWQPQIAWTWYAMVGGLLVMFIGLLFRTPDEVCEAAERKAVEAETSAGLKPMALR
ncbi:MAG: sodium/solute symporter [bacterium]|nr:sodium/solute symporter [Candidatus Sumerlaeota bacterium]